MIQLDTHALIWRELEPEKLSTDARVAIKATALKGDVISISAMTLWEIALLVRKKRILLEVDIEIFLQEIEQNYWIAPITVAVAVEASKLPDPFPKDPMDRLIVATALANHATLITADRSILASKACKLLW
jgi:PIN domain nuclease of toxin-antitoxin system